MSEIRLTRRPMPGAISVLLFAPSYENCKTARARPLHNTFYASRIFTLCHDLLLPFEKTSALMGAAVSTSTALAQEAQNREQHTRYSFSGSCYQSPVFVPLDIVWYYGPVERHHHNGREYRDRAGQGGQRRPSATLNHVGRMQGSGFLISTLLGRLSHTTLAAGRHGTLAGRHSR